MKYLAASSHAPVAAAVLARWLFCLVLFPTFLTGFATVGEQFYFDSYREIAAQLAAGHGYRVAPGAIDCLHRPPGYVAILLLAFPAGELAYLRVQLLNGLLGGLATWMTIVMARQWGLSRRGAVLAGWGVALWPFLVWETKITVPENLLVALLPAAFAALGKWRESGSLRWLVATGLLAAAATLTHALYQLLLPGLLVAILALRRQPRRWRAALVVSAVCLAAVAPWMLRNAAVAGRPVGVATGFGLHYLRGLHSWRVLAAGEPYFRDHDPDSAAWVGEILAAGGFDDKDDYVVRSDPAINRYLDERAWRDARARPAHVVLRALVRAPLLWVQQQTPARSLATAVLLLPFFALAVYGLARRWRWELAGPLLTLLGLNLATAAIYPEAIPMRYALPLIPLLMFFAARGYEALPRQRPPRPPGP